MRVGACTDVTLVPWVPTRYHHRIPTGGQPRGRRGRRWFSLPRTGPNGLTNGANPVTDDGTEAVPAPAGRKHSSDSEGVRSPRRIPRGGHRCPPGDFFSTRPPGCAIAAVGPVLPAPAVRRSPAPVSGAGVMTGAEEAQTEPRPTVLLVDDNDQNLVSLEALLAGLPATLVRCASGPEALARLAGRDAAVVLLDVQMPAMDGLETARQIRAREPARRTPIIFLTAYDAPPAAVVEAYRLGAVDYLVKPLVPEILRAKVAGFL